MVSDVIRDVALDHLINNGDLIVLCSQLPTTFAEANATYRLASFPLNPGSYSKSAGDVSGKKVATVDLIIVNGEVAGTGTHYAILDTVNNVLLVAEALATNVTIVVDGKTVIDTFDIIEIRAATPE